MALDTCTQPYASSYILNGHGKLPAWPIRVACSHLAVRGNCPFLDRRCSPAQDTSLEGPALVSAMADAVGVFYNWSGSVPCFDWSAAVNNDTKEDSDFWFVECVCHSRSCIATRREYQSCTEQFMPMSRDGGALLEKDTLFSCAVCAKHKICTAQNAVNDMFWRQPFDEAAVAQECARVWGVRPRPLWPTILCGLIPVVVGTTLAPQLWWPAHRGRQQHPV